jgi:hypothetical protein
VGLGSVHTLLFHSLFLNEIASNASVSVLNQVVASSTSKYGLTYTKKFWSSRMTRMTSRRDLKSTEKSHNLGTDAWAGAVVVVDLELPCEMMN